MSEPQGLILEADGIHILWDDGHEGQYPHWYLRAACQCAECRDSVNKGQMRFYDSIPRDVHAVEWNLVGRYAIELAWSDNHSGIYAFETLRPMCRCRECTSRLIASRRTSEETPSS